MKIFLAGIFGKRHSESFEDKHGNIARATSYSWRGEIYSIVIKYPNGFNVDKAKYLYGSMLK